ncbi:MAG: ATP-binding protein [Elusimicrobiota bacterium]|nr:ATP-binding protein [Elusimicrobiota bacterium]MDH5661883.1 ATP-binding protein [Elusimicrobiota bacterium]
MIHYALAGLLTFLVSLAIAFIVYFRSPKRAANRFFALFSITVALYGLGFFKQAIASTSAQEILAIRINLFGTIFMPIFFLCSIYRLLEKRLSFRTLALLYGVGIFFEIVNATTDWFAKDPIPRLGFNYLFQAGFLYPALALGFLLCIAFCLVNLLKGYRYSSGLRRNQLKYLFWAALIGFSGGSAGFALGYNIDLYPFNPFGAYFVFVGNIFLAYAIVTYRLMDINVAITRGTVFAAVYAFVLATPLAVGYWGKTYLFDRIGGNWWSVPVGMALVLASLGPTTYGFIRRKTEAALFSERRRYQRNLIALAKQMTLTKDLRSLLVLVIRNVTREIGISHARMYLLDRKADEYVREVCYGKERRRQFGDFLSQDAPLVRMLAGSRDKGPILNEEIISHFVTNESEHVQEVKKQLRSLGASLLLPAFIGEELVAFLVLGTKRSKEMYTPDDLDMFKILAGQAALAVENAQFYQELKESQATMLQAAKLSSIGELATGFAHQIDNPLAMISAGCQLCMMDIKECLERGNVDENDSKALQSMEDRMQKVIDMAHRGAELVQRIKGYAKPSDKDFEATDLNSIIEDSLTLAQYQISHGGVNVTKDIPEGLPKIKGISVQLQQAFLNMIINACEAMAGKKGELAVSARVANENPGNVEILLADNGRGISKENLKKIFDIFFTTKGSQGTGMGLSLAHRIIKDHGGNIAVDSEVGKGTKFTITLPVWEEKF